MKPRSILYITLLAILVSLFAQACSGSATRSTATGSSRSKFTTETSIEIHELEVKSEMISNQLKIKKINLTSGQFVLRLSSPDGLIQWEEIFIGPTNYHHTYNLDVTPGIWKLEIELENASGNFDIQWKASN